MTEREGKPQPRGIKRVTSAVSRKFWDIGDRVLTRFDRGVERWNRLEDKVFGAPPETIFPITAPDLRISHFEDFFDVLVMSGRPDFYSGSTAREDNVGQGRFFRGYQALVKHNGEDAAKNYAQMILDMFSFAPSNVVRNIHTLARKGWQYDPEIIRGSQGPHPFEMPRDTDSPNENVIELFEELRALGPSSQPDETAQIKAEFIAQLRRAGVIVEIEDGKALVVASGK